MNRRPPSPPLFPYTALFRSAPPLRPRRGALAPLSPPEPLPRRPDEAVPTPPPRPWVHDPSTVDHELVAELEASRKRLTEEEKAELLALIEETRREQERQLARRGGRPLPPSWPL